MGSQGFGASKSPAPVRVESYLEAVPGIEVLIGKKYMSQSLGKHETGDEPVVVELRPQLVV